jgi:hypothetical protein
MDKMPVMTYQSFSGEWRSTTGKMLGVLFDWELRSVEAWLDEVEGANNRIDPLLMDVIFHRGPEDLVMGELIEAVHLRRAGKSLPGDVCNEIMGILWAVSNCDTAESPADLGRSRLFLRERLAGTGIDVADVTALQWQYR